MPMTLQLVQVGLQVRLSSSYSKDDGTPVAVELTVVDGKWAFDPGNLADGLYSYTLKVTDDAGKTSTSTKTLRLDTNPPDLKVINLESGAAISTSSYEITGAVSDISGFKPVEYSLNGSAWATVSSPGQSWKHSVTGLTEGADQVIKFRASDKLGNVYTTNDITFGLDLYAPTLTDIKIDGTAFESWIANTSKKSDFVVSGKAYDISGIKKVEISLDGGVTYNNITTPSGIDINWSETVEVPANGASDGVKAVKIRATDEYGKVTEKSFTVKFDSLPPVLTVSNLTTSQLITTANFELTGTWTDQGGSGLAGGLAKLQYKIGTGENWVDFDSLPTNSNWKQTIPLEEGIDQTISVRGIDYIGNVSVATENLGTTVTQVKVSYSTPSTTVLHDDVADWSGNIYKKGTFKLSGVATDSLGVESVVITVNPVTSGATNTVVLDGVSGANSRNWSMDRSFTCFPGTTRVLNKNN
jgi:large repetitive protein